ncbi:MAG TPA: response regulator [Flavobacterium sp.]|nr:response regulator [Flavobacterium sp.]
MEKRPVIFYTDDDKDDLDLFADAATALPADVRLFREAGEMLIEIERSPDVPSLIFVDLNMPLVTGFDVIKTLRAHGIQTPVVVLSTGGDASSVEKTYSLGANYYIKKPASVKILKEAIAHILGIDWKSFKPSIKEFTHRF